MSRIDLTPFIREDKGSEIVIGLPCKSTERAYFNGYQTWTASYEVKPTDTHNGIRKFSDASALRGASPNTAITFS